MFVTLCPTRGKAVEQHEHGQHGQEFVLRGCVVADRRLKKLERLKRTLET